MLGGLLGAGIGGYVSYLQNNYVYAGVGAAVGIILGRLVQVRLSKKLAPSSVISLETKTHLVLMILSFLMALAGGLGFLRTGDTLGLLGAVFFGLCGAYFVFKYRQMRA